MVSRPSGARRAPPSPSTDEIFSGGPDSIPLASVAGDYGPVRAGPKAQPKASALPRLRGTTPSARFAEFCRRFLRHQQGALAGTPVVLAPWQVDIVRRLLDTVDEHGLRRYRQALITVARRNGKTVIAACLALFELYYGERGGEIIGAAGDRQQAHLAFDVARRMVEASPALADVTLVYRRQLVVPHRGSTYRVVSSDAPRQHGINCSFALIDELHAHKDRRLFDALASSGGSRAQPLVVVVSTATDDPHSVMAEFYDYAVKVRDGIVPDDALLPVIFSAPLEADPFDEATWRLANPALGAFRDLTEFRIAARQAREIPGRMAAFRALYLNQMYVTAAGGWLDLPAWDACGAPVDRATLRGRPCYAGVDLSSTQDLSALAVVFPPTVEGGVFEVLFECWLPAANLVARARREAPFDVWARGGHLTLTEGNVIDELGIERAVRALVERDGYDVREVRIDPWNGVQMLARLQADGIPARAQPQTIAALTHASKALEGLVLTRRLRHGGHPVARWCASNVVVDSDHAENVKPSKRRSKDRIDLIAALVNALSALPAVEGSVYDARPPLLVEL